MFLAGRQCGVLPSYTVDAQSRCVKFVECSMSGRAGDARCVARAQK